MMIRSFMMFFTAADDVCGFHHRGCAILNGFPTYKGVPADATPLCVTARNVVAVVPATLCHRTKCCYPPATPITFLCVAVTGNV